MELLDFYLPSIIASIFLLLVLGLLGYHLIARNQSLEVLLLGQEFQTAILVSAFILSVLPHIDYDHHGIHLEIILTLVLAILSHLFFRRVFQFKSHIKTEGVVGYLVFLMGLNQLVILISPLIEMHMVKSYIGDIVTVSKTESYFLIAISLASLVGIIKKSHLIFQDSLDLAIFGKITKKRKNELFFNAVTLCMMLFSIHHFGVLFTLGAILIPGLVNSFFLLTKRDLIFQVMLSSLSPILAFTLTTYNDRLPTTVLILFIVFGSNIIYGFIRKLR
jgi:hypothetical protein